MDLFQSARISELEGEIKKHQNAYYNGEALISDEEFDALWDELKALDPDNPVLKKIGADDGNFAKVKHRMPMGSQEKAANPEEFTQWAEKHPYDEHRNHRNENLSDIVFLLIPLYGGESPFEELYYFVPKNYQCG